MTAFLGWVREWVVGRNRQGKEYIFGLLGAIGRELNYAHLSVKIRG